MNVKELNKDDGEEEVASGSKPRMYEKVGCKHISSLTKIKI